MATVNHRGPHRSQVKGRRKSYPPVSKTFETKAEANRWARLVEWEMDHGVYVSREEAENTTFAEAFNRYANEITPRKKGARQERDRIDFLKKHALAHRSLASIRGADIAAYRDERLEAGKSPITVNNECSSSATASTPPAGSGGGRACTTRSPTCASRVCRRAGTAGSPATRRSGSSSTPSTRCTSWLCWRSRQACARES